MAASYSRWRRATHRAAVWLAAVVARGHVSHLQHRDAAAVLRVAAIRTAEAPQAAEDPLDGGRVVAQHVGSPRHVVAVAGGDRK